MPPSKTKISPANHPDSILTLTATKQDSSWYDGSEVCEGDTYLPLQDNANLIYESYNLAFMEKDGNYVFFSSGLAFNCGD